MCPHNTTTCYVCCARFVSAQGACNMTSENGRALPYSHLGTGASNPATPVCLDMKQAGGKGIPPNFVYGQIVVSSVCQMGVTRVDGTPEGTPLLYQSTACNTAAGWVWNSRRQICLKTSPAGAKMVGR